MPVENTPISSSIKQGVQVNQTQPKKEPRKIYISLQGETLRKKEIEELENRVELSQHSLRIQGDTEFQMKVHSTEGGLNAERHHDLNWTLDLARNGETDHVVVDISGLSQSDVQRFMTLLPPKGELSEKVQKELKAVTPGSPVIVLSGKEGDTIEFLTKPGKGSVVPRKVFEKSTDTDGDISSYNFRKKGSTPHFLVIEVDKKPKPAAKPAEEVPKSPFSNGYTNPFNSGLMSPLGAPFN